MQNLYVQSQPAFVFAFALATWGSDPHFLKTATYSKVNWPLLAAPHQWHHCLLHQCHHCPQQRLGLVHCLPPHICLCVLPFFLPLLFVTTSVVTYLCYNNICSVMQFAECHSCILLLKTAARPCQGSNLLMGYKSGCLLLDGTVLVLDVTGCYKVCLVLQEHNLWKYLKSTTR